jgi:hypothetical protein
MRKRLLSMEVRQLPAKELEWQELQQLDRCLDHLECEEWDLCAYMVGQFSQGEKKLRIFRSFLKDYAITVFVEKKMPSGRKRKGIPKSALYDAKDAFELSQSAIIRAYSRVKSWREKARLQP